MSRMSRNPRRTQLELFQPQITRPQWTTLPTEVRQRMIPLLVQLLTGQRAGRPVARDRKETGDE